MGGAQVKLASGEVVGRKAKIYWYNGAMVVGVCAYQKIMLAEYRRVLPLGGQ